MLSCKINVLRPIAIYRSCACKELACKFSSMLKNNHMWQSNSYSQNSKSGHPLGLTGTAASPFNHTLLSARRVPDDNRTREKGATMSIIRIHEENQILGLLVDCMILVPKLESNGNQVSFPAMTL